MSKHRRLSFEQYPTWQLDKESNATQVKDRILCWLKRRKKRKKIEGWNETLHLLHGGTEFVALKIGRQYPLVLL
jgi:hypothetical protein